MIDQAVLQKLQKTKNLLAFSAGIDSTALFFLLLENSVDFDIAIVNYNTRKESDQEVFYAKQLADQHGKKLSVKSVVLEPSNFEKTARDVRYKFFEEIITDQNYEVLITAHQLNDWVEWYFMQFTKGAGFWELNGMQIWQKKESYILARPLLGVYKDDLENYLIKHNKKYFVDSTNKSTKYKRNLFRNLYTDELIKSYRDGIKRSFEIAQYEKELFDDSSSIVHKDLLIVRLNNKNAYHQADLHIKRLGHLCSFAERELIKNQDSIVVGKNIAVCKNSEFLFVAPFVKCVLTKEFKEECRKAKIPPKIRAYIFANQIDINLLGIV